MEIETEGGKMNKKDIVEDKKKSKFQDFVEMLVISTVGAVYGNGIFWFARVFETHWFLSIWLGLMTAALGGVISYKMMEMEKKEEEKEK